MRRGLVKAVGWTAAAAALVNLPVREAPIHRPQAQPA